MDDAKQERDPRVERAFLVQVNQDLSANPPRWDIVTAQNISASGILLNFNRYVEPGTRMVSGSCFRSTIPSNVRAK